MIHQPKSKNLIQRRKQDRDKIQLKISQAKKPQSRQLKESITMTIIIVIPLILNKLERHVCPSFDFFYSFY